jgi:CheY-like chemotaxis protein
MPKILVIEDDRDMVAAIRMPLEANGFEVLAAVTGEEGLQKVKEVEPDLIILDVMMETTTDADRDPHHHVPALRPRRGLPAGGRLRGQAD